MPACMLCGRPIRFWQWYDEKMHATFQSEDCGEHKMLCRVDTRDGNKRLVSGDGVKVPIEHTGHSFSDQMDRYGTPGPMREKRCAAQEEALLKRARDMDRVPVGPNTNAVVKFDKRFVPHEFGNRGQCEVMPMKIYRLEYEHHVPPTVHKPEEMPERGEPIPVKEKNPSRATATPSNEEMERIKPNIPERHAAWEKYKLEMLPKKKKKEV